MPLLFNSSNKGQIAFGFFNIETDMLLLENYFFFASDFCKLICSISENSINLKLKGYIIYESEKIGDLMGAIHGIRFTGFIGEVYKKFPFPKDLKDFKQNPEGFETREVIKKIIIKYGKPLDIPVVLKNNFISIGDFEFTKEQFSELLNYVWLGGYPQWRDNIRPDYVLKIEKQIENL